MRSRLLFRIKHGSWQSYRLVRKQSLSNGYLRSSEMLKVSLKNIKQELLFGDSHKFGDLILTKPSHLLSESNQSELFSPWQQLTTFTFCMSTVRTPFYMARATSNYMYHNLKGFATKNSPIKYYAL